MRQVIKRDHDVIGNTKTDIQKERKKERKKERERKKVKEKDLERNFERVIKTYLELLQSVP